MKKSREKLIKHIGKDLLSPCPLSIYGNSGVPDYQHGLVELSDDIVSRAVRIDLFEMIVFIRLISLGT